ncbi:hypothetical protein GN244_ATG16959 [Phytophthora infestans]|uniref:Uncharacterized protein n=1 Tax=Phytophthora infestans TaxID=4787 RepID=A0A833SS88_PHYIN|nr:hypothetical protein GN244_ATG16959 [Phytophthora infestans]KAF4141448.1 hypothetical protein GN958_ATG09419 [Phytophthora infestans]
MAVRYTSNRSAPLCLPWVSSRRGDIYPKKQQEMTGWHHQTEDYPLRSTVEPPGDPRAQLPKISTQTVAEAGKNA